MTRIVAGALGSRPLKVPRTGTRPTAEMIREAMFSHLEAKGFLTDAKVLDLFAGSGALGFEALSRGAVHATFVDSSTEATKVIRANTAALQLSSAALVLTGDALQTLDRLTDNSPFDLVFLDPPYALDPGFVAAVLQKVVDILCHEDTIVVLEGAKRCLRPALPSGWEAYTEKNYGDTRVSYLGSTAASS